MCHLMWFERFLSTELVQNGSKLSTHLYGSLPFQLGPSKIIGTYYYYLKRNVISRTQVKNDLFLRNVKI